MTDTLKPPMVIYFRENISTVYMDGSHMDNRFGHAFANKNRESDVGPYVHLDQFLAEVERRALGDAHNQAETAEVNMPYPDEDVIMLWFRETAIKLAKELKEQHEN